MYQGNTDDTEDKDAGHDQSWSRHVKCLYDIVCGHEVPQDGEIFGPKAQSSLAPVESWLDFVGKMSEKAQRAENLKLRDELLNLFPQDSSIIQALHTGIQITNDEGLVSESDVARVLEQKKPLAVWFCNHNVGVLFLPSRDEVIPMTHVTAYQLQVDNANVMAETKPTAWFPTARTQADNMWLQCAEFARQVSNLSQFTPSDCIPKAKKDGHEHNEERETVSPKYFTEWLLPTLDAASGERRKQLHVDNVCVSLLKSMHDLVQWKSARVPWRRSKTYVGLKAMLHVQAAEEHGEQKGRARYKLQRLLYLLFVWKYVGEKVLADVKMHGLASAFLTKLDRRLSKLQHDASSANLFPILGRYCGSQLSQAHKRADEVWSAMSSVPKLLPAPNSCVLDEDVCRFIEQRDLAQNVIGHTEQLQSLLLSSCKSSFYKASKTDDELSGCSGKLNTFISTVNTVFTSLLRGENPLEHLTVEDICKKIEAIETEATGIGNSPLVHSQKVLVTFALFRTIDIKVAQQYPQVSRFNPGIEFVDAVSQLVLPSNRLLMVAHCLESWYQARLGNAVYSNQYLFQKELLKCPRVKLAASELVTTVLACEEKDIEEKKAEVKTLRQKFDELDRQYHRMSCTYQRETDHWGNSRQVHCYSCEKCSIGNQKEQLKTQPVCRFLPQDTDKRIIIGFEMTQPVDILLWRHAAAFIKSRTLGLSLEEPLEHLWDIELRSRTSNHPCVGELMTKVPDIVCKEIQLGSTAKWTAASHYGSGYHCKHLHSDSDYVFPVGGHVEFGVKYSGEYQKYRFKISPASPFAVLDECLDVTTDKRCTQNLAIATQSDCPTSIGLTDFVSFGSIRSGCLLQHRQLLNALVQESVNFGHKDVLVLVAQTLWESLQPNGKWSRKAAALSFANPDFVRIALDSAHSLAEASKEQWEHPWALTVTAILASRCLAPTGTTDEATIESNRNAISLLKKCRNFVLKWYGTQLERLRKDTTSGQLEVAELTERQCILFNIGFVGLLTFLPVTEECAESYGSTAGDSPRRMLIKSDADVLDLLLLSGAFHDNTPSEEHRVLPDLEPLVNMILVASLPQMREHLSTSTKSLTQFAQEHTNLVQEHQDWTVNQAGSVWYHICVPSNSGDDMVVEVDILHGSVLVNGAAVTSLPPTVRRNPAFREMFGSGSPLIERLGGSRYATRPVSGAPTFFFTECDQDRIVIEMTPTPNAKNRYVLLDREVMSGIPTPLRVLHSHWRCGDHVAFLPRNYSAETCKYFADPISRSQYTFNFAREPYNVPALEAMDVNNKPAYLATQQHLLTEFCLSSLERADDRDFTYVWWQPSGAVHHAINSGCVLAHADRVQLCFTVKEGLNAVQLHADFCPGLIVAGNQNFGTLMGLSQGLLLEEIEGRERKLVIPLWTDGHTRDQTEHTKELVSDSIRLLEKETDCVERSRRNIPTLVYQLHYHLHQLISPPDTTASIYLAYLHAITSGVPIQPDLWTGCTGSEAAMTLLQSPLTRRHEPYSAESLKLLGLIRALSPKRKWYPEHLKTMESVTWPNLPPQCSLEAYSIIVDQMVQQNSNLHALFTETQIAEPDWYEPRSDAELSKRAARLHSRHLGSLCILADYDFDRQYDMYAQTRSPSEPTPTWLRVPATFETRSVPTAIDPEEVYNVVFGDGEISARKKNLSICAAWCIESRGRQLDIKRDILSLISRICSPQTTYEDNLYLLSALAWQNGVQDSAPFHMLMALAKSSQQDKHRITSTTVGKALTQQVRPISDVADQAEELAQSHRKQYEASYPKKFHFLSKDAFDAAMRAYMNEEQKFKDKQDCKVQELKEFVRVKYKECRVAELQYDPLCGSQPWNIDIPRQKEYFYLEKLRNDLDLEISREHRAETVRRFLEFCSTIAAKCWHKIQVTQWTIPNKRETRLYKPSQYALDRTRNQSDKTASWSLPEQLPCAPWDDAFTQHCDVDKAIPPEMLTGKDDPLSRELDRQMEQSFKSIIPDRVWNVANDKDIVVISKTYLNEVSLKTKSLWQQVQKSFSGKHCRPHQRIERNHPSLLLSAMLHCRTTAGAPIVYTDEGRKHVIELVRLWTLEQKVTRVLQYTRSKNSIWRTKELINPPHRGWDPTSDLGLPWLCLELENNMSIWTRQHEVCMKMLGTDEGRKKQHRIVQLNMGEGKTSVILPMLAAALSDGCNLCRVVVPSALYRGTADALSRALGGLLGRQIWTMPCRRDVQFDTELASRLLEHYQNSQSAGAVVVTTPESILSFQLKLIEYGVKHERFIEDEPVAVKLREVQKFILEYGREVLDEADSILHYKRQLVYTMGTQQEPSGGSQRYKVLMSTMTTVFQLAPEAAKKFPTAVKLSQLEANSSVPRFLERPGSQLQAWKWFETQLLDRLLGKDGCADLRCPLFGERQREVIDNFVLNPTLTSDDLQRFNSIDAIGEEAKTSLVLLRGLLAYSVLKLALTKRWRVDYGVDLSKSESNISFCKMAVPFEARDCAKPKTEFGHVDMAIVLTVISYCRSSLSDAELDSVFDALMSQPDPGILYQSIIADGEELDPAFKSLNSINRTDKCQKYDLYKALKKRLGVIRFFLVHIVFPREVKQFPHKLVATPWDLVPTAKVRPLCGFSGTNDTELLLPPSVHQTDIPELKGTNARVLKAIMHDRNNIVKELTDKYDLEQALEDNRDCKVLLDVGALLLEDDKMFALRWLKHRRDCKGVVMYQNNRLVVLSASGSAVPFSRSPLSGDLASCLVLLDEEHCRGTDLRLPQGSKAALTLGRGVSRDKFVQAAMRMRALISGDHSLVFFAASEVYNILSSNKRDSPTNTAVVGWTLDNTRQSLSSGVSHWLNQGIFSATTDHYVLSACDADVTYKDTLRKDAIPLDRAYAIQRAEMDMVQICEQEIKALPDGVSTGQWINEIKKKCTTLFSKVHRRFRNALVDEEQERELEIEKEVETQIERPGRTKPACPTVSQCLKNALRSSIEGPIGKTCNSFLSDHIICANGKIESTLGSMWSGKLLCTPEFMLPVKDDDGRIPVMNEFLRPVGHVLHVDYQSTQHLVLISPVEAEYLANHSLTSNRYVAIPRSATITMHIFTAKARPADDCEDLWRPELAITVQTAATLQQRPSNNVDIEVVSTQLHLFGGSTYFNLREQMILSATLGICCAEHTSEEKKALDCGWIAAQDGFVDPKYRVIKDPKFESVCKIRKSAVIDLRNFLISARRLGVRFEVSPLGKLLISATHSLPHQSNGAGHRGLTLDVIKSNRILTATAPPRRVPPPRQVVTANPTPCQLQGWLHAAKSQPLLTSRVYSGSVRPHAAPNTAKRTISDGLMRSSAAHRSTPACPSTQSSSSFSSIKTRHVNPEPASTQRHRMGSLESSPQWRRAVSDKYPFGNDETDDKKYKPSTLADQLDFQNLQTKGKGKPRERATRNAAKGTTSNGFGESRTLGHQYALSQKSQTAHAAGGEAQQSTQACPACLVDNHPSNVFCKICRGPRVSEWTVVARSSQTLRSSAAQRSTPACPSTQSSSSFSSIKTRHVNPEPALTQRHRMGSLESSPQWRRAVSDKYPFGNDETDDKKYKPSTLADQLDFQNLQTKGKGKPRERATRNAAKGTT